MGARVIALTSRKGGVGKTTSAVHLVDAVAALGRPVTLVDTDPMQHASAWIAGWSQEASGTRLRQIPEGLTVVSVPDGKVASVERAVSAAAADEIIVLDLPGGAAAPMVRLRKPLYDHAGVVVFPSRPSVADAKEILQTAPEVPPALPAAVLLTMVRARSELMVAEVRNALDPRINVLESMVPSLAAIERSFGHAPTLPGRQAYGAAVDELLAALGWA